MNDWIKIHINTLQQKPLISALFEKKNPEILICHSTKKQPKKDKEKKKL